MDKLQHTHAGLIKAIIQTNIKENFQDALITIAKANLSKDRRADYLQTVIEAQKEIEKANQRLLSAMDNLHTWQMRK